MMNIFLGILGILGFVALGIAMHILHIDNELFYLRSFTTMSDFNEQYRTQHDNYLTWAHEKGKHAQDCDEDLAMLFYYLGKYDASCEMLDATIEKVNKIINTSKK